MLSYNFTISIVVWRKLQKWFGKYVEITDSAYTVYNGDGWNGTESTVKVLFRISGLPSIQFAEWQHSKIIVQPKNGDVTRNCKWTCFAACQLWHDSHTFSLRIKIEGTLLHYNRESVLLERVKNENHPSLEFGHIKKVDEHWKSSLPFAKDF